MPVLFFLLVLFLCLLPAFLLIAFTLIIGVIPACVYASNCKGDFTFGSIFMFVGLLALGEFSAFFVVFILFPMSL